MAQKPDERPFVWMHSLTDPGLAFALVDAYAWDKDFMLEVDDAELEEMGSLDPMDYAVYFILRIQKQDNRTTLQAKPNAPLLVNVRNRQARQVDRFAQPRARKNGSPLPAALILLSVSDARAQPQGRGSD